MESSLIYELFYLDKKYVLKFQRSSNIQQEINSIGN